MNVGANTFLFRRASPLRNDTAENQSVLASLLIKPVELELIVYSKESILFCDSLVKNGDLESIFDSWDPELTKPY